MADAAEVRAFLTENGIDVPAKGKLSAAHWAQYAELSGVPAEGDDDGTVPGPAYDGGVTEADFGPEPDKPGTAVEVAPVRPRRQRKPLRERLRTTPQPSKYKRGTAKKAVAKRIPVDRLISDVYAMLGRLIEQVMPPVGRCIAWQAPTAGIVLEDKVRGTLVDRVLQPVARAEDAGRAAVGIFGLPVAVARFQAIQGIADPQQRAIQEAFLVPVIRELIVINIQLAGERMEEVLARQVATEPMYAKADELLMSFFAPPPGQAAPAEPAMATA